MGTLMMCLKSKILWLKLESRLYLQPTSRSRAAVARRAHNPKVGGSIPPFATRRASQEAFFIMYTVYVLYSSRYNKIYIGCTTNMEQRFLSHNKLGKKGWTIKYRAWHILYTEQYDEKSEALLREKALKSGKGRAWIRETLVARVADSGSYPPKADGGSIPPFATKKAS